ncbi:S8 family serine peptidase [Candidatus Mycoplasma pogonae]
MEIKKWHKFIKKFSSDEWLDQLKQINFIKQREKENLFVNSLNYEKAIGKIGILEYASEGGNIVNSELSFFENKQVEINGDEKKWGIHGSFVASIAGGKAGVDRFAKIYSTDFRENEEWQQKLEWLVIEKGVRVINHSYGSGKSLNKVPYNDESYFIDYLARKYGVVNVFASGNGNDKPDIDDEWIDNQQLSFNSIVVGSSIKEKNKNLYKISEFSNRLKFDKYSDLPKPLVVAPGEGYKFLWLPKEYGRGTSLAAPIVTGAISALLRENPTLNNDNNRVSSIKAILAASGNDDNFNLEGTKKINANGLENAIGAGIIDFEKMKEAASNLVNLNINKLEDEKSRVVYESPTIKLLKGQKIQVASSWLFNAGILKNEENIPEYNWQFNLIGFIGGPLLGGITSGVYNGVYWSQYEKWKKDWEEKHINSSLLKKSETFARQNSNFFTDYDLYLEKKDFNGNWETVKSINVVGSNVELIKHLVDSNGEYRIKIKKYFDSVFDNSINDVLSVTYVKK